MKIVRLTEDVRPFHKGQDAVVPDDAARRLIKDGQAEDPRPFPPESFDQPRAGEPELAPALNSPRQIDKKKLFGRNHRSAQR